MSRLGDNNRPDGTPTRVANHNRCVTGQGKPGSEFDSPGTSRCVSFTGASRSTDGDELGARLDLVLAFAG